jgi:ribonuclease VapC
LRFVVDTSVLAAIRFGEAERPAFHQVLLRSQVHLSIASYAEFIMVTQSRRGPGELATADRLLDLYAINLDRALLRDAVRDFARGRRSPPAVLNFGDLFANALARRLGLPLLFKGSDFSLTDVEAVAR